MAAPRISTPARARSKAMATKPTRGEQALMAATVTLTTTITTMATQFDQRFTDQKLDIDEKHKQNRDSIHRQSGALDTVIAQYAALEGRVRVAEEKVHTIIGTGDGGTGALNEVRRGQESLERAVSEIATNVKIIQEQTKDSGKTKEFMQGWKGVGIALAIMASIGGLIGLILTGIMVYEKVTGH